MKLSLDSLRGALVLCLSSVPALASGDPVPPSGGSPWGADYFPNVPLVTHEGKTVRFFDDLLKDKVVVINFIYTSCPDACPLETAKLVEVQDLLRERVGKDVFMYSISIDPERDTPEKLREYSERFQTGPGWLFLTGAAADIKLVREKLGMLARDETSLSDHSLSLMIGNQATGQWMKRSPFENPYFLSSQIGSWLTSWKVAPAPGNDYADAPDLREISRGENLFRTRCAVCHAIGAEDGLLRQGPNLMGVSARREPAWLARWLAEPDVMLAEGDPIALELRAAYRDLPMPNMRLNGIEVDALLEYLAEESARLGALAPPVVEEAPAEEEVAPCCRKLEEAVIEASPAVQKDPEATFEAPPTAATPSVLRAELPMRPLVLCAGLGAMLGLFALRIGRRS